MQGKFCPVCKSLLPPSSDRCVKCGRPAEGLQTSNQSCLADVAPKAPAREPKTVEHELADAPYMPYEPRGCQLEIINDIYTFLEDKRHVVIESGTGTGKTITSLAASLQHAKPKGKAIIYLVRTITQTDAVMKELRAISKIKDVKGLAITGRGRSCPLFRGSPEYDSIPSNILSLMCDDRRNRSIKGQAGGCRFYDKVELAMPGIEKWWAEAMPSSDEFDRHCEKLGVCPYEAKKRLMKKADVIAVPYIQILNPDIRASLLANLDLVDTPNGLMIIVDEAHNFLDAARDTESFIIDKDLIDNAMDDADTFKSASVWPEVPLKSFITFFKSCIRSLAIDKLGLNEKSAVIKEDYIEEKIIAKYGLKRSDLDGIIETMEQLGEARTERLVDSGDNRISPVEELAHLMRLWFSSGSERFVRTINAGDKGEYLRAACIDPEEISRFLNSIPCTLHMSGTLQPLDQYARVLGLGRNPRFRTYPSPFPKENKLVIYDKEVTTKQNVMQQDPSMQPRIERKIVQLCDAVDKNTLVFFTSYNMMRKMRPFLERNISKPKYWEESGNPRRTSENLARFREGRNGVFFSVMGGSIAEGIDFPGDELCFAVIVGIPFPPPSKETDAMKALFDERYNGKGWLYTSQVPAMRKLNQAIGRLIRTETDRGAAVILDNRMNRYVKDTGAEASDDPVGDVMRFFYNGS